VSVQELYRQSIKPLPASERLRLARLILNDIAPESVVDYSEAWSDEDYRDFSSATWNHITESLEGGGGEKRKTDCTP
jgi:hypothetical protein